ncbi:MAG TPA: hypothetical protein DCP06_07165 [Lachnospiraceae bacterium]|nr:hypothetical protein [Lachnospiraceae bacterium]
MSRRKSRQRIQFSNRTHPSSGILSLVMGGVSFVILIVLCLVSGGDKGESGPWMGIAGLWTIVLSGIGFFLSTKSYRMEDIYRITPVLGSVFNGVVLLVLLFLYIIGSM